MSLHSVYSIGGELVLLLDAPLASLPRRKVDGTIVVMAEQLKKSYLVEGRPVRLRREANKATEVQYRFCCPRYTDSTLGYQLQEWSSSSPKMLFLYEDMVFESTTAALVEVMKDALKKRVPPCYFERRNTTAVRVKPLHSETLENFVPCQYLDDGNLLGVTIDLPLNASEEDINRGLIQAAAISVFGVDESDVRLDWESREDVMVLLVNGKSPAKLHLAVERQIG
mmetsp:Transcript_5199/g.9785  ORF Transcript_5199/g.9785 Transcript_5199/m.9785 type:complete len:225 (-) Transcript_5199:306-980(-)